jgi:MOSC domain-containing protein YiiM
VATRGGKGGAVEIVSVNVATPSVLLAHSSGDVISSIDKRPVTASTLALSAENLDGDQQADTRPTRAGGQVHGGEHQAVYAFPSEHFPRLSEIIGTEIGPGYMGENLTLRGATEGDVCIGDVWRWGAARLQISAPRGPCYKLGIRMGRQAARTAIRAEGLVGWYLRVLTPGDVPTSGQIEVEERHPSRVTVRTIHRAIQERSQTFPEWAALEPLAPNQRLALLVRDRDLSGGVPESDG